MARPVSASLIDLVVALSEAFDDCDAVRVSWKARRGWREVVVTPTQIKGYVRPFCGYVTRVTLPTEADWDSEQAADWVEQVTK